MNTKSVNAVCLVAASPNDEASDTHWYRPALDQHLFQAACDAGVDCQEGIRVTGVRPHSNGGITIHCSDAPPVTTNIVIDASGSAAVTAEHFGNADWTDRLHTRTGTAFAHFSGIGSYSKAENNRYGDDRATRPFDADDAAQHHLLDTGWMWMLRMNHDITSVGITVPIGFSASVRQRQIQDATSMLENRCARYPRLAQLFRTAHQVAPDGGVATIGRIQRWLDPVGSTNCVLLPTTAVTLDPLHSTGIAHALAGVERLAELLLTRVDNESLAEYRRVLIAETEHLDRMVALAYTVMPSFRRFTAACMIYFAAAIACEEAITAGESPACLWLADDPAFRDLVRHSPDLFREDDDDAMIDGLRRRLQPWNTVGLLDDSLHNRYAYTATK